jgi:orotidine-5'-phosphate decarboxylase
MAAYLNTYADRAKKQINPAARDLLEAVERKQSNLCVSVDVTSSKDFLSIIDAVGPYVSLIKASIC